MYLEVMHCNAGVCSITIDERNAVDLALEDIDVHTGSHKFIETLPYAIVERQVNLRVLNTGSNLRR